LRKPTTAAERLQTLLPWVNGDSSDAREPLAAFLKSFDGSASSGHLRALYEAGQDELQTGAVSLDALRRDVEEVLMSGFPPEPGYSYVWGSRTRSLPSLRFGVWLNPHARKLPAKARHWWRTEPGAFIRTVDGKLRDLAPYLVMHLMTMRGMVTLARCPAPAAGDWMKRCGRFLVSGATGRPRTFCRDACKVRADSKKRRDLEQSVMRKKSSLRAAVVRRDRQSTPKQRED
jgi:hypothetical protein